MCLKVREAFKTEKKTVKRAPITYHDLLKSPTFLQKDSGKGKRKTNAVTLPIVISGEEQRAIVRRKASEREKEKQKLARKFATEEYKRKKRATGDDEEETGGGKESKGGKQEGEGGPEDGEERAAETITTCCDE